MQSTELNGNKPKSPSKKASIPLGREKKAIGAGGRRRERLGWESEGEGERVHTLETKHAPQRHTLSVLVPPTGPTFHSLHHLPTVHSAVDLQLHKLWMSSESS